MAHTASLYEITASLGPVTREDSTSGAIPSPIPVCRADSRGLPAGSVTLPLSGSYMSAVPAAGAVPPGSSPSSRRTSTAAGADRGAAEGFRTTGPTAPAAGTDTDQPRAVPAASPSATTDSLRTTCTTVRETAVALRTDGDWPSSSVCVTVPPSSSRSRPSPVLTDAPSMVTLPVALGGAPAGENVITCVRAGPSPSPPARPATSRSLPSTTSDAYASCGAAAGLVYSTTAVSLPVIFDEITVSDLPSWTSRVTFPPARWFAG